jgi:hypothetical protein
MSANDLDERSSSGGSDRTGKTSWTTQTGLQSRRRRFESCRGRLDKSVRSCVGVIGWNEIGIWKRSGGASRVLLLRPIGVDGVAGH